jgi:hypothetical protein
MLTTALAITAIGFGCAQNGPTVRPDEMSAEAHRQEAQRKTAAADKELREANTPIPQPNLAANPGGNPEGYYYDRSVYDAKNEHLARSRELRAHAQEHEAAAAYLEKFEEVQCKEFPSSTRAACPLLGPVVRMTDIPAGVRVEFARGARVDAALAHMRCHLAFAQARGFQTASSCPLYMKGIEIRPGAEPRTIEIVSTDAKVAHEIQRRSREEAILVQSEPQ